MRPPSPNPRGELTIVEHLEELRVRLLVSLAAFAVALALCIWQNHLLLRIADAPLHGRRPVTFGIAEPFTVTLTVAAYAALALSLPVLLYQLYAYVLPAFTPAERRIAKPLLALIPALFAAACASATSSCSQPRFASYCTSTSSPGTPPPSSSPTAS